jgi:hypothetical protein
VLARRQHLLPASNHSFVVLGAHQFGAPGEQRDDPAMRELAAAKSWAGVLLVEASPPVAAELRSRILARSPFPKAARVAVSNVGICPPGLIARGPTFGKTAPTSLPFYSLSAHGEGLPQWVDEVGSFSQKLVHGQVSNLARWNSRWLRHHPNATGARWTVARLRSTIREAEVPCSTLEAELTRHGLPPPAVLIVDIEGLDCAVIEATDWCHTRPWVVRFEHSHCRSGAQVTRAYAALRAGCGPASPWNYTVRKFVYDSFAYAAPLVPRDTV